MRIIHLTAMPSRNIGTNPKVSCIYAVAQSTMVRLTLHAAATKRLKWHSRQSRRSKKSQLHSLDGCINTIRIVLFQRFSVSTKHGPMPPLVRHPRHSPRSPPRDYSFYSVIRRTRARSRVNSDFLSGVQPNYNTGNKTQSVWPP